MSDRRYLIHAIFLLSLPVLVAALGLSLWIAIALVLLALAWRWALVLGELMRRPQGSEIVLDTILMSHFAEKVRWALDRLGIPYAERPAAGIIGVLFTGRTVPRLRFRTGRTRSSIGNSPEILRYLWGAYAVTVGEAASFLEPTNARLIYEQSIDRYGASLQVWVYYHIMKDRDLTLRIWGASSSDVSRWQRLLLRISYPLLASFLRRAFAISEERYARSVQQIEELLGDIDIRLADGRGSILGDDEISFVDITFASLSGLWLQPDGYAAGKAESCRVARSRLPEPMQRDIERWIEDYPRATRFVERLYREERLPGTNRPQAGQTPVEDVQTGGRRCAG